MSDEDEINIPTLEVARAGGAEVVAGEAVVGDGADKVNDNGNQPPQPSARRRRRQQITFAAGAPPPDLVDNGTVATTASSSPTPAEAPTSRRARRQLKMADAASIILSASSTGRAARKNLQHPDGSRHGRRRSVTTLRSPDIEEEPEEKRELSEAAKAHIEWITEGMDPVDFFAHYHGKYCQHWDSGNSSDDSSGDGMVDVLEKPVFEFGRAASRVKSSKAPARGGKPPDWRSHRRQIDTVRGFGVELSHLGRIESGEAKNCTIVPDTASGGDVAREHGRQAEGFYVGVPPKLHTKQMNRIHNRCKLSDERSAVWLSSDGRVAQLPNPVLNTPMKLPDRHPFLLDNGTDERTSHRFPTLTVPRREGLGCAIDLNLQSVQFKEHFLFLEENRLARELEDLCAIDTQRQSDDKAAFYELKLVALNEAKKRIDDKLSETGRRVGQDDIELTQADRVGKRLRERAVDYRNEIRTTRELRDDALKFDITTKESIVKTWNQLRAVRENQGFQSTPHMIKFKRDEVDAAADVNALEADVEEIVKEEREEYERMMHMKQREFLESKAQKEHLQKSKSKSKPGVPKEFLEPFDEEASREKVRKHLLTCRRPPGVPNIIPLLQFVGTTPNTELSKGHHGHEEATRRARITQYTLGIDVIVNGRRVHRTSANMESNFEVHFDDSVQIHLDEIPREVVLSFWEEGKLPLCELFVPIPEPRGGAAGQAALVADGGVVSALFSCDKHIRKVSSDDPFVTQNSHPSLFKPDVGYGTDDDLGIQKSVHFHVMKGRMNYTISVSPQNRHHQDLQDNLAIAAQNADAIAALGAQGVRDHEKLAKWAKQARIDPNDPRNAHLLSHVQTEDALERKKFYRLVSDDAGEADMNRGARMMEKSKRHRLLALRKSAAPGFETKVVPLIEEDILEAELEFKKRRSSEVLINPDEDQPRFLQTAQARFLRKIRASQAEHQRQLAKRQTLNDVVNDNLVPSWSSAGGSFLEMIFGPPRPLRPVRAETKKLPPIRWPKDSRILVRVVRAWGLPVRNTNQPASAGPAASDRGRPPKMSLAPYVEILFQNESCRTSTIKGPSPLWNELFDLKFIPPSNNFSPESLRMCKDIIHFNFFDHVEIDLTDDLKRETHHNVRREKRFIGSFSIPVSTILENQVIDGTFEIELPLAMLGYSHTSKSMNRPRGFVSLYLASNPPLEVEPPAAAPAESYEEPDLIAYSKLWAANVTKSFAERVVYPLAQDIEGMSVLITRYIHLQHPPPSLIIPGESKLVTLMRLARFVSMIPYADDTETFVGAADSKLNIWSTSDQFLQLRSGDNEEHAILLCNYFLSVPDVEAYAVMGKGIPDGELVYVLTSHPSDPADVSTPNANTSGDQSEDNETASSQRTWRYWDPLTGKPYKQTDTLCPLQQVFCIFNEDNIWANMQPRISGINIRHDLTKQSQWRPFFAANQPAPALASVQIEQLSYFSNSADEISEIEKMLEMRLKASFEKQRQQLRLYTKWNLSCSRSLKQALSGNGASPAHLIGFEGAWIDYAKTEEILTPLKHISETHRLMGIPINFPFTTYTDACERLHRTNMHSINEEHLMEFALAVHVVPYGTDDPLWQQSARGESGPQSVVDGSRTKRGNTLSRR